MSTPLPKLGLRWAGKRHNGREEKPRLLLALSLSLLALIAFVPLFYALSISFRDVHLTTTYAGQPFVGLKNFIEVFQSERAMHSFLVTFELVLSSVAVETVLGTMLALLIHGTFPRSTWLVTMIVLPMTIPKVVASLVWNVMYNPVVGIIDYILGLFGVPPVNWLADPGLALFSVAFVDIWQWTPFIILIILAGLGTLPAEPFEAARVEGASALQTLSRITLPLLKPFITIAVIFRSLDAMRTFDYIYTMTRGGPGLATETVDLFAYNIGIAEGGNISIATAASIILLVITIIVTTLWVRATKWGEEVF